MQVQDCRKRWFHSLDPSLRKGRWTECEDRTLLSAYAELGAAWHDIALLIPGRKDDQCAKRYNEILEPSAKTRLRQWTAAEDTILTKSVQCLGNRWAAISARLENRPPLTCRNRWRYLSGRLSRSYDEASSDSQSQEPASNESVQAMDVYPTPGDLEAESMAFPISPSGGNPEGSIMASLLGADAFDEMFVQDLLEDDRDILEVLHQDDEPYQDTYLPDMTTWDESATLVDPATGAVQPEPLAFCDSNVESTQLSNRNITFQHESGPSEQLLNESGVRSPECTVTVTDSTSTTEQIATSSDVIHHHHHHYHHYHHHYYHNR
jgi:Myb-like DNA-binding protein BAS1